MSSYINTSLLIEDIMKAAKPFDKLKKPKILKIKVHPFFFEALTQYSGYVKFPEYEYLLYGIMIEEDVNLTKPFELVYN